MRLIELSYSRIGYLGFISILVFVFFRFSCIPVLHWGRLSFISCASAHPVNSKQNETWQRKYRWSSEWHTPTVKEKMPDNTNANIRMEFCSRKSTQYLYICLSETSFPLQMNQIGVVLKRTKERKKERKKWTTGISGTGKHSRAPYCNLANDSKAANRRYSGRQQRTTCHETGSIHTHISGTSLTFLWFYFFSFIEMCFVHLSHAFFHFHFILTC